MSYIKGNKMKNFIAALTFFFCAFVFAMGDDTVFVTETESGGQIYLISTECPLDGSKGARVSLLLTHNRIIYGCWFYQDQKIYVLWFLNETTPIKSVYEPSVFRSEKLL
jgi:hypothetical protein